MKRRTPNVFSLSFLDCITCGLGAIILLFVIINAKSAIQRETVSKTLEAETNKLEEQVLEDRKELVVLRNTLEETTEEVKITQGLSRRVIAVLQQKKVELADDEKDTLSTREHVNKLKADLKALEEEYKRLEGGAKTQDDLGARLRPFPGQGDRQYLTDLKMGGKRILILVDASASMLDETIVGIIRRRNLSAGQMRQSPKWRQAVATIDWLTTQLPPTSKFQVYAFNETAWALIEGTGGTWLDAGDVDRLNQTVKHMHALVPEKGTSLLKAFDAVKEMTPGPDNIFLLVDGLPTMGAGKPLLKRVSGRKRLSLFRAAVGRLPSQVPINVILYPMEGDPMAADAYWRLAKQSRGAFFCPSKDWP